jgi:probable phosphoglycerate mutase
VLVRHGATESGDVRLVGGQTDASLSPRGVAQARHVAARLSHEPITGLFVTPLRRTVETAAPLAAAAGLNPVTVKDLREVHLGDLELRFASDERDDLLREVLRRGRWDIAPGAETGEAFTARVAAGLAQIAAATAPGGRGIAFVHGGVVAEACRQATGSRPLAFLPNLLHGSITRFRVRGSRLTLASFNDVAHLQAPT